jgi:NAD(P)-dependent dehydrogenase (short-subunit alcohol dehydrogenase family)
MEHVTGKVAVITGAGSGIGLGLAREFGAAGCLLSLADIDADDLAAAAESLRSEGIEVLTTVVDVGRIEDMEHLAARTLAEFDAAHIIVNNAGVIAWNTIEALTIGDWRWVIDVNLWGVIHGVHVFLPILARQNTESHFVNVSSIGGVLADVPFMATYSATKAAVIGLSLTLASELRMRDRPTGVTIVCPGPTQDTHGHAAERHRPAASGPMHREAEVQGLVDIVGDQLSTAGQPLAALTRRVLDAVRRNDLWAFPNPAGTPMVLPRLESLSDVLRAAGAAPMSD